MSKPKIDFDVIETGERGLAVIGARFPRLTDHRDIEGVTQRLIAEIAAIDKRPQNFIAEAIVENQERADTIDKVGFTFNTAIPNLSANCGCGFKALCPSIA